MTVNEAAKALVDANNAHELAVRRYGEADAALAKAKLACDEAMWGVRIARVNLDTARGHRASIEALEAVNALV
jgi:hypothetical protein